ncbi:MAG: hypothetical protein ACLFQK_07185, partial [Fibrobacterota bacterium]
RGGMKYQRAESNSILKYGEKDVVIGELDFSDIGYIIPEGCFGGPLKCYLEHKNRFYDLLVDEYATSGAKCDSSQGVYHPEVYIMRVEYTGPREKDSQKIIKARAIAFSEDGIHSAMEEIRKRDFRSNDKAQ